MIIQDQENWKARILKMESGKKKMKWQLDKLQLELRACRILVAQEILMSKEGQLMSVVSVQVLPALFP